MRPAPTELGLPHLAVLLVAPFLCCLFYARTLDGSFLSDDFLLNVILTKDGAEPAVDWAAVFADFGRGWLALNDSNLYRPVVTLSFAVNYALGGAEPWGYHLLNVLCHTVATLCTGMLCAMLCPYRRNLAAILGGCLFAFHPTATECACWISARNSGIEVMCRQLAFVGFAMLLRRGLVRDAVLAATASVVALCTKETAVLIPLGFLCLDLLLTPRRPWRARLRLHLAFAPLWIGYLVLRKALLGVFLGAASSGHDPLSLGTALVNLHNKLVGMFVPFLTEQQGGRLALFYTLVLVLLVWTLWDRRIRGIVVFGFGWLLLNYAPSYQIDVPHGIVGGRLLYGSVAILAIVLCVLVVRLWDSTRFRGVLGPTETESRARRAVAPLAVLVLLSAFLVSAHQQVDRYMVSYRQVQALQRQLVPLAEKATEAEPLVMVSVPPPTDAAGLLLRADTYYTVSEVPFMAKDHPLVGTGFVWDRVPPLSFSMYHDAGPLRALWRQGATLLNWQPAHQVFAITKHGTPTVVGGLVSAHPNRQLFRTGPVHSLEIEALQLSVAGDVGGGELMFLQPTAQGPQPVAIAGRNHVVKFAGGERRGDRTLFHVDLSHDLLFYVMAQSVSGFAVDFDQGQRPPFTITPVRRLPEFDLRRQLHGDTVVLGREPATLLAPPLPAPGLELHLVLLGPGAGCQMQLAPDRPVEFPVAWRRQLKVIHKTSRQRRYYYYFEARTQAGYSRKPWRTPMDWFVLELPGRNSGG